MPDFSLRLPIVPLQSLGNEVLDVGEILTATSPCGSNCSYDLHMVYPAVMCRKARFVDLQRELANYWAPVLNLSKQAYLQAPVLYIGNMEFVTVDDVGDTIRAVAVLIQYNPDQPQKLECLLYNNVSTVHFEYQNDIQTIERAEVSGSTLFSTSWLESIFSQAYTEVKESPAGAAVPLETMKHLSPFNRIQANNLGIFTAFGTTLSGIELETSPGYLKGEFDDQNLISVFQDTWTWGVAANFVEQLLFNTSMSWSNLTPNTMVSTNVTNAVYTGLYQFEQVERFFVPYGATLGISFIILLINLLALKRNGVSADSGFFQTLRTTAGIDESIRLLALESSSGDAEEIATELMEMNVRFEAIENANGEDSWMGFRAQG